MKYLLISLFSLVCFQADAQELNIKVNVNAPNIATTDPRVFQDLESNITEFLNNTRWTDDEYEDYEKIEGSLNITISQELSTSSFLASFNIQALRPVYNSNYKTQLINFVDPDVPFEYTERQPIQRSEDNYFDNLSSVLTFWAIIMIGYDYDSFSPMGGDEFFQTANNMVTGIPESIRQADKGWASRIGENNRFQLVDNLISPRVKPLRQAMYEYHRLSLDAMTFDADKSKAIMTSAITAIGQVHKELPNSMIVQMFSDSKRLEIIEIYKDASRGEQSKIYDLMVKIDPYRTSDYSAIK